MKFPGINCFQDVGNMQTSTFQREEGEFVQVLYCFESHWVLVTNKNSKVMVYDSGDVSFDTKKAVAFMIKTPHTYYISRCSTAGR